MKVAREVTTYWLHEKLRRGMSQNALYDSLVLETGRQEAEYRVLLIDVGVEMPLIVTDANGLKVGQRVKVRVAQCDPRLGQIRIALAPPSAS